MPSRMSYDKSLSETERRRLALRTYRNKHPERVKAHERRYKIKKNWGMSPEEYDALIFSAECKCEICHKELIIGSNNNKTKPCIDHDHSTGQIRGVLCGACNLAIGYLQDSADRCYSAFQYLNGRK